MDKKHYEQLKAVNEHLAMPAPEQYASNDIAVICGVTKKRAEELIYHMHRMSKDDHNLVPRNIREKILQISKVVKTPGELAFLAYKTGEFDVVTNPDQLMERFGNIASLESMTREEREKKVEQIVERGMSHGN